MARWWAKLKQQSRMTTPSLPVSVPRTVGPHWRGSVLYVGCAAYSGNTAESRPFIPPPAQPGARRVARYAGAGLRGAALPTFCRCAARALVAGPKSALDVASIGLRSRSWMRTECSQHPPSMPGSHRRQPGSAHSLPAQGCNSQRRRSTATSRRYCTRTSCAPNPASTPR